MNRDPLHAAVRIASTPALRVILSGPEPLMEALEWHPENPAATELTRRAGAACRGFPVERMVRPWCRSEGTV